jgi:hypothetical protein
MGQLEHDAMSTEEQPHGNTGNDHAKKPAREKLSETRTFRFKKSELASFNRVKDRAEPLRIWVRRTLCEKSGHPLPLVGEE